MRTRSLASLIIFATALLAVGGCATWKSDEERRAERDGALVGHYFLTTPTGGVLFHVGDYQGGSAIIGPENMAFWVKDGKAYTVNQAARDAAPDLDQAPDTVKLDRMFEAAVRGGFED